VGVGWGFGGWHGGSSGVTETFNDPNHANPEQHFSRFRATLTGERPMDAGHKVPIVPRVTVEN